jgi:hypothetical protein
MFSRSRDLQSAEQSHQQLPVPSGVVLRVRKPSGMYRPARRFPFPKRQYDLRAVRQIVRWKLLPLLLVD